MITEHATDEAIRQAARVIQSGGLVAFPTETVYGLGADAFNAKAVSGIYEAKNRPTDNPLILHVLSPEDAAMLAEVSPAAQLLMDAFWPGPLTLVLRKHASQPGWVGGHPVNTANTLAIRAPSHPVARKLIEYAGCAIAAPSANKAGTPSPTQAAHVAADLGEDIDFLLDGGTVPGGLESTVVDMTGESPVILRPGAVTADMIYSVTGIIDTQTNADDTDKPRSPGMKYRHYAPHAPMTVVTDAPEAAAVKIADLITKQTSNRCLYGILATTQTVDYYTTRFGSRAWVAPPEASEMPDTPAAPIPSGADIAVLNMGDRDTPETIAHALYACLRRFDTLGVEAIYAEGVADTGLGQAIMNRMMKAAGGRIV